VKLTEPQFIYMLLVLPALFGLTLVAEGLNKIWEGKKRGWLSFCLGAGFIICIVTAYFFFLFTADGV